MLALAVLAFPLTYTALYAASTSYAKENNFLQVLPFTALAAAFLLVGLAAKLAAPVPARWRAPAGAAGALLLAIAVASPTQAWVYRTQVPETWDLALAAVSERLHPWEGRVAYVEASREALGSVVRRTKGLIHPVDDLSTMPADLLDQADAEVFSAAAAGAATDSFHRLRAERHESGALRFEPRWFAARGPEVVALIHAREASGSFTLTALATGDGVYRVDLPAGADGELFSAEMTRRRARAADAAPEILLGERPLRLQTRTTGAITAWLSERFPVQPGTLAARIHPADGSEEIAIRVYRWR